VFHVIATADNDSGFLAEFNSELGWFSVVLYDEKAQRELKELLAAGRWQHHADLRANATSDRNLRDVIPAR
jgi:hypothetical protein